MIRGAITALVTPFKNDQVDEQAFADFIEWQIAQGIHGVVPCGTTGESATLSDEEHRRVIKVCVDAADGRVPVIAGTGSNETSVAISYTRHAKEMGADAALVVAPYYNKPNQEGMFRHFKAIHDAVDIPMVIYNVPGRTVVDISNETMGRLAELENVIGCKDATGDVSRVTHLKDLCGEAFIQLSGDDPSALGHAAHGGHGAISVGSNLAPKAYADMFDAALEGDFLAARAIHERLDRLHKDVFLDPSPSPTKYGLSLMGKMGEDVRLPITECSDETRMAMKIAMIRAGINA